MYWKEKVCSTVHELSSLPEGLSATKRHSTTNAESMHRDSQTTTCDLTAERNNVSGNEKNAMQDHRLWSGPSRAEPEIQRCVDSLFEFQESMQRKQDAALLGRRQ